MLDEICPNYVLFRINKEHGILHTVRWLISPTTANAKTVHHMMLHQLLAAGGALTATDVAGLGKDSSPDDIMETSSDETIVSLKSD